jgi:hypothetical protein
MPYSASMRRTKFNCVHRPVRVPTYFFADTFKVYVVTGHEYSGNIVEAEPDWEDVRNGTVRQIGVAHSYTMTYYDGPLSRFLGMIANQQFLLAMAVTVFALLLCACAAAVVAKSKEEMYYLAGAEVIALGLSGLAWFLPGPPLRLFFGLYFCIYGLTIHSRVCTKLSFNDNTSHLAKREATQTFNGRFFSEMANILYANIFLRVQKFTAARLPTMALCARVLAALVVNDIGSYLVFEWMPNESNVSANNLSIARALVAGVGTIAGMEFIHCLLTVLVGMFGAELPRELQHTHPLLSGSLAEFWGERWNPIAAKLLQDSFYKPLRSLGISRSICKLACFSGSALLHAWPVYMAKHSLQDTIMVCSFFLAHGVCMMLEGTVKRILGYARTKKLSAERKPSADVHSSEKSTGRHKLDSSRRVHDDIPFQSTTELLLTVWVLFTAYYLFELQSYPEKHTVQRRTLCLSVALTSYAAVVLLYYHIRRRWHLAEQLEQRSRDPSTPSQPYTLRAFLVPFAGWMCTVLCILALIPLFSLPILHCLEGTYTKSFFVGSLVRACST